MVDPLAARAGIPEHDLAIVLGPDELAPVAQLMGALDIRIESDDPWLRILPPRQMPDDVRVTLAAVRAACHGSADVAQLRERVVAAAAGHWLVTVVEPDDPRDWVLVQLRVPDAG